MSACAYVVDGSHCGAVDDVRLYPCGPRCPEHTPAAIAGEPEPSGQYCAPARCYCGSPTCPAYPSYRRPLEPVAETVVDRRAVESGRRAPGAARRRQHAATRYQTPETSR
ncbi:MAG TPA: hypothetical protein VIK91_16515 [Nannocystis sp.]